MIIKIISKIILIIFSPILLPGYVYLGYLEGQPIFNRLKEYWYVVIKQ